MLAWNEENIINLVNYEYSLLTFWENTWFPVFPLCQ